MVIIAFPLLLPLAKWYALTFVAAILLIRRLFGLVYNVFVSPPYHHISPKGPQLDMALPQDGQKEFIGSKYVIYDLTCNIFVKKQLSKSLFRYCTETN